MPMHDTRTQHAPSPPINMGAWANKPNLVAHQQPEAGARPGATFEPYTATSESRTGGQPGHQINHRNLESHGQRPHPRNRPNERAQSQAGGSALVDADPRSLGTQQDSYTLWSSNNESSNAFGLHPEQMRANAALASHTDTRGPDMYGHPNERQNSAGRQSSQYGQSFYSQAVHPRKENYNGHMAYQSDEQHAVQAPADVTISQLPSPSEKFWGQDTPETSSFRQPENPMVQTMPQQPNEGLERRQNSSREQDPPMEFYMFTEEFEVASDGHPEASSSRRSTAHQTPDSMSGRHMPGWVPNRPQAPALIRPAAPQQSRPTVSATANSGPQDSRDAKAGQKDRRPKSSVNDDAKTTAWAEEVKVGTEHVVPPMTAAQHREKTWQRYGNEIEERPLKMTGGTYRESLPRFPTSPNFKPPPPKSSHSSLPAEGSHTLSQQEEDTEEANIAEVANFEKEERAREQKARQAASSRQVLPLPKENPVRNKAPPRPVYQPQKASPATLASAPSQTQQDMAVDVSELGEMLGDMGLSAPPGHGWQVEERQTLPTAKQGPVRLSIAKSGASENGDASPAGE